MSLSHAPDDAAGRVTAQDTCVTSPLRLCDNFVTVETQLLEHAKGISLQRPRRQVSPLIELLISHLTQGLYAASPRRHLVRPVFGWRSLTDGCDGRATHHGVWPRRQ